ncbi:S8 family serine peptidase, partial [bacterium]|nr:S8 family serine peptidase [bacterium]
DLSYWIFFIDKQGSQSGATYIDPHALERRRLRGFLGQSGDFDLSVSQRYIQQVLAVDGVKYRGESRWLNAVSVDLTQAALTQIESLSCVENVQPITKIERASYEGQLGVVGHYEHQEVSQRLAELDNDPDWLPTRFDPNVDSHRLDNAWYGPSLNQNLMVNALEAHYRGNHGQGVRITVLDGGYQLDHEAFNHLNVIAQYDFINNDDDVSYDPVQDVHGQPNHGTACMSVIGGYNPGNLIGLAHEADFILCKTEHVPTETELEEDYWIRAVEWSEALGADVLSSSLSYQDWWALADYDGITSPTSRAATIAYELGMALCTSAGNEGPMPMTIGVPTEAEGVLSIGACQPNGEIARFSSRGPTADGRIKPDICAQGVRTACASPHSWNEYSFWNGTSLSCPVAAGCMALIIAEHPDWSPSEVYEAVRWTASHAERPDNVYGWGIVNVEEAIHYPSVSGWVMGKDGYGMDGITIRLEGAWQSLTTTTTDEGFYRFPNLRMGEVQVQAIYPDGIASSAVTLTVPLDCEIDFSEK